MSHKWIRKGDRVVVLTGNEKGRTGKVLSRKGDRIVIQGINVRKRHVKKSQQSPNRQIIDIEQPVHISNIAMASEEGKALRVKVRFSSNGEKELYYREEGKEVLLRAVKKSTG